MRRMSAKSLSLVGRGRYYTAPRLMSSNWAWRVMPRGCSRWIINLRSEQSRLGERSFQKIILQRQLADLGVQRSQVHRLGCLGVAAERISRVLGQLPLPFW